MKIDICALSKSYSTRTKTTHALKNVSFSVDRGEILCILGNNGAGKTTLIKSICGLLKPDSGDVLIDGVSAVKDTAYAHRKCGTVLEGSRNIYYYLTAYENLQYFGILNGLNQKQIQTDAERYLQLFDLKAFRDVPASSFSRGMQQKLAITVALMKRPEILLLDEPTLGLDILSSESVIQLLKDLAQERKLSILITTHDIHLIEQLNCRLIFMNHGKISCDSSLAQLKQEAKNTRYRVTWQIQKESIPADAQIQQRQNDILIFETEDAPWLADHITSPQLVQIEKCNQSVAEIYKGVMGHA